jgi:CheY-like chemotaxis protein
MAKKVMVVDDNPDAVKLTRLMLEEHGYEVIGLESGDQALSRAPVERPDLIILDIMMPELDGYEVCRRLRAHPATANIPILMFTAKSKPKDKEAGFLAGADDYMTKPVVMTDLVSRVALLVSQPLRRQAQEEWSSRAKVLGFLGSKGGVGTTTLAVNVAIALVEGPAKGKQVVLADLRPGMATVALQLDLHAGGLARLLSQPEVNAEPRIVQSQLEDHSSGVRVLTGQLQPPGVAAPISPTQAETVIKNLSAIADYLLLDLGVGLGETNSQILSACHHSVVVIEPQRAAITLAQMLLGEITRSLGLPNHKVSLVMIHKVPFGSNTFTKHIIEAALQHELIGTVTPAQDLAFQSAERAMPMIVMQPDGVVARQFRSIAEQLSKI